MTKYADLVTIIIAPTAGLFTRRSQNMTTKNPLEELSSLCGILTEYRDIWGGVRTVSRETRQQLLRAMGISVGNSGAVLETLENFKSRKWARCLDPVYVIRGIDGPLCLSITLPCSSENNRFQWTLEEEGGPIREGSFRPSGLQTREQADIRGEAMVRYSLSLPLKPGLGYHRFTLSGKRQGRAFAAESSLVLTPRQCYLPASFQQGARIWGPSVQLYALRSRRNWGMGDFTDLHNLVRLSAQQGGRIVGLNPLHELFPHNPSHASPYSPSSRSFLNIFYIDVESIQDFFESKTARALVSSPGFQAELSSLRAGKFVDYSRVADSKMRVLEILYRHFCDYHMKNGTAREKEFREFQRLGGEALERQALFEALQEHFQQQDPDISGWPAWPEAYGSPQSEAVKSFAVSRRDRVEFFQYLQWQAEEQLGHIDETCGELGLDAGLYRDLAVSVDKDGGEAWSNQSVYALDANVGAPPDDFNFLGQDWGLPPMIPFRLYEEAYRPFIQIIRNNMRHAGALRIDHIMAFHRLFWIPSGMTPEKGAYCRYPLQDFLGILALESQRNHCMVIGEDLGTVPEEVRKAMAEWNVFAYRVLYFERVDGGSAFKAPDSYPAKAVATVTTHDLPTLKGYWIGRDNEVREALDLFPGMEVKERQIRDRDSARSALLKALKQRGLLPKGQEQDPAFVPGMTPELVLAVHRFLARTPCQIQMIQLEDVLGERDQVNMPGTVEQYPNWRRKVTVDLREIFDSARCIELCKALTVERHGAE